MLEFQSISAILSEPLQVEDLSCRILGLVLESESHRYQQALVWKVVTMAVVTKMWGTVSMLQ